MDERRRQERGAAEPPLAFVRLPGSPRPSAHVEDCPVGIDARRGRLDGVVRLVALGRCDALKDAWRCAWPMAPDREDARASVRERDREDGRAVGPRTLVDVVDETDIGLGPGGHPADKSGDDVATASTACGSPRSPSIHGTRAFSAPPRDEMAASGEGARVAVWGHGRRVAAGIEGRRRYPGGADDV